MTHNQTTNELINQKRTDNQTEVEPKIIKLCASSKNVHLKFGSKLKICDIDSKREYFKRVFCAIGIGISQILIGATLMTIFLYSLRTGDTHAIICSLAYHFFSAEAILTFNHSNGWSKPLRLRHKRCMHIFMQLCALVCATIGMLAYIPSGHVHTECHGITGFLTIALAVLTLVLGPLALYGSYRKTLMHTSMGLITFTMSSISLCLGILTPTFKNYVDSSTIIHIIISFIIFYTLLIIITCIIKHVTQ